MHVHFVIIHYARRDHCYCSRVRPFSDPEHVDGCLSVNGLQRDAFILLQTLGLSPATLNGFTVS